MPAPYWTDKLIESPRVLIDKLLGFHVFKTSKPWHVGMTGKAGMIFRGQSDTVWNLIPTAFREGRFKDYAKQPPHTRGTIRERLGTQLHAEVRSVFSFLQVADGLGIHSPIDYTTTKEGMDLIEAAINNRDAEYDREFPPASFQRATALAQHHGVPTRFLDWSESPLVALYFAAVSASNLADKQPRSDQEIAVYFVNVMQLDDRDSPIQLVRAPRHENTFLLQQQGVFTSFRSANTFFLENDRWPSFEDYSARSLQLHRYRLSAGQADEALQLLYDLGVTRHSLMPTLDNAATAFKYAKTIFPRMFPAIG